MKKQILAITIALSTALIGQNALAKNVKTSSLAIAKPSTSKSQAAPKQCQQLFNATDKLIAEAARQPGTHSNLVQKMKTKLSSTKQQILKLDVAMQQKSCDKGLVALNDLVKRY
ncbi:DUF5339 domain-containing protein [Haemophilus paracuniculus]|uniref:DUF5339 domain-containing protein n=1 Tax=Haemophilus paracuniculus TaxID=734 RepID=UPI0009936048|nr:DUF5339 domain-containing protein [Haemophilus paracuniculus]